MVSKNADKIERMFSSIAPRYDMLNRLLSMGIDRKWRSKAIKSLSPNGGLYLDVATGTGDMALEISAQSGPSRVIGTDLSHEMLKIGVRKTEGRKILLGRGDALCLAFGDGTFDGVTCAFGIRNFADLQEGLSEIFRVLKPGGKIAILEFTTPENPVVKALYLMYFTKILPLIGGLVSGNSEAYSYLPESVIGFPDRRKLRRIFMDCGFDDVGVKPLTFGICDLVTASKPLA